MDKGVGGFGSEDSVVVEGTVAAEVAFCVAEGWERALLSNSPGFKLRRRTIAWSRPSLLGKLMTPRVRWRVPTGRTASVGTPKLFALVTSALNEARLLDS
jgi:hypothetical protein